MRNHPLGLQLSHVFALDINQLEDGLMASILFVRYLSSVFERKKHAEGLEMP